MKRFLIALFFAAAWFTAGADQIARRGEEWVRLTSAPCTNAAVLAALRMKGFSEQELTLFAAASAHVNGADFQACWILMSNFVELIYDDGDPGEIPFSAFKFVPEARDGPDNWREGPSFPRRQPHPKLG